MHATFLRDLDNIMSHLVQWLSNTYTFVKDGVKAKLVLLPPNEFNEGQKESKSLVSLVAKEPS